ncbi:hypothetical protein CR513_21446, partial [Mucuna pruriens]
MHVGQLADTVSQMQSVGSRSIPFHTILNLKGGGIGTVRLRSSRELPQLGEPQSNLGLAEAEIEPGVDCQVQQPARSVLLPFPNQTVFARRSEIDEDLLKLFKKVEINIPLLQAIKQVPKYAKFLKELCVHKRKKIKGAIKMGGIVSALVKHKDPSIFIVPCTISNRTFIDAMLDLATSINIMLASVYKSLNLGYLKPTRMEIQLANKSVVQPLCILVDVLVQVNELIFPVDFYVLDMEDKPFEEGSALILG